jgi:uncharacterized protein DUF1854
MSEKIMNNNDKKEKTMELLEQNDGLRLERREDGQIWAIENGLSTRVRILACFPWTSAMNYISLRDDEDNEIALIKSLYSLDDESRKVVKSALTETGFIMEIIEIHSITDDFEIRNWKVDTAQGARTFQTELGEWPRVMPNGELLIKDVAGDLYMISDPGILDKKSRKLIWAYLD